MDTHLKGNVSLCEMKRKESVISDGWKKTVYKDSTELDVYFNNDTFIHFAKFMLKTA